VSVRLLGRAFYAPLPSHLKLTLLALCDEANDQGLGIFIGQKRLAEKVGSTDRTVRSNLAALREAGYIVREEERHPRWGTDQYEIVVAKLPEEPSAETSSAPEVGRIADRKSSVVSTGSPLPTTRERPVSKSTREGSSSSHFAIFWETYPLKVGKRTAGTAFERAARRASPARIIEGAIRYANDPNREQAYTAHPTTWLNRDGWEDAPLPGRGGTNDQVARVARELAGEVS